jgi:hypothetical protein
MRFFFYNGLKIYLYLNYIKIEVMQSRNAIIFNIISINIMGIIIKKIIK